MLGACLQRLNSPTPVLCGQSCPYSEFVTLAKVIVYSLFTLKYKQYASLWIL